MSMRAACCGIRGIGPRAWAEPLLIDSTNECREETLLTAGREVSLWPQERRMSSPPPGRLVTKFSSFSADASVAIMSLPVSETTKNFV